MIICLIEHTLTNEEQANKNFKGFTNFFLHCWNNKQTKKTKNQHPYGVRQIYETYIDKQTTVTMKCIISFNIISILHPGS